MGDAIRWGILGTGAIAALFAEGLEALPDAPLVAIGSRTREGAESFAREYGVKRAYGSYEELVRDPEVDVVYIATPNSAHAGNAILAIEHGKAVLCEKPFTMDAAEARRVIEAARRHKVFCMEGMWMRFVPAVRELAGLVRGGAIGDVRMLNAGLGFPFVYDPKHRVFDPAMGGGAMLDLGVYPLSLAFHLLGRPKSFVTQAVLGETGVDEQASVLFTFDEGRQASITTSIRKRTTNDAAIFGTDGMIHLHEPIYCPQSLSVHPTTRQGGSGRGKRERLGRVKHHPVARTLATLVKKARARTILRHTIGNGYAHEIIEVMRCLREGAKESPIMPLDESLAIMETMDALRAEWARAKRNG